MQQNTATVESIKNWFNEHYARKGKKSMRNEHAYPVFLDYLNARAGERILDIGCGPGWLLKAADARGLQTCGIDLAPEAKQLCAQSSPNSKVKTGGVENIRFPDDHFDYITLIGVLEHFLDLDKAVSEMKRIAKADARFCIMVPNSATLHWKISERFSAQNRDSNENAATLSEWTQLFEKHDFEVEAIHRDEWQIRKPLMLLTGGLEKKLSPLFKKIIWSVLPVKSAHQFVFILKCK